MRKSGVQNKDPKQRLLVAQLLGEKKGGKERLSKFPDYD